MPEDMECINLGMKRLDATPDTTSRTERAKRMDVEKNASS